MEVLCRGAFGMDAKRGTMGQGWPTVTTLGTVPKRGKFRAAKPGCRVRFLFGYFLFRASKEKVTRRKGETGSGLDGYRCAQHHPTVLWRRHLRPKRRRSTTIE